LSRRCPGTGAGTKAENEPRREEEGTHAYWTCGNICSMLRSLRGLQ
jgi:hypothetical protein